MGCERENKGDLLEELGCHKKERKASNIGFSRKMKFESVRTEGNLSDKWNVK